MLSCLLSAVIWLLYSLCLFVGKSSQVPQFLLDANIKPILCTQPRRFAVVAVAKMVAKARKCVVGEEVGYHIGHSKHLSPRYTSLLLILTAKFA